MTNVAKPSHWSPDYAAWFKDPLVVQAYPMRPPYPDAVFALLESLVTVKPIAATAVLDLGAGTGDIARRLAPLVGRLDAVDVSAAMMARGQNLPGGDHPHLRWILGSAEEAPLAPPYGLITAGESLHWMAWDVVLARAAESLAPGAAFAIVERSWNGPPALRDRLLPIFTRYSPVSDYQATSLLDELAKRGLFEEVGRQRCAAPWTPTMDEYVECRHSQRGFSRTHMGPEAVRGFDAAITALLAEMCRDGTLTEQDGRLQLEVTASVVWGHPVPPAAWSAQ